MTLPKAVPALVTHVRRSDISWNGPAASRESAIASARWCWEHHSTGPLVFEPEEDRFLEVWYEDHAVEKLLTQADADWRRAVQEGVPCCPTCGGPVNVSDSENPYSKDIHQMSLWCLTVGECADSLQPLNYADCQQAGILAALGRIREGRGA